MTAPGAHLKAERERLQRRVEELEARLSKTINIDAYHHKCDESHKHYLEFQRLDAAVAEAVRNGSKVIYVSSKETRVRLAELEAENAEAYAKGVRAERDRAVAIIRARAAGIDAFHSYMGGVVRGIAETVAKGEEP